MFRIHYQCEIILQLGLGLGVGDWQVFCSVAFGIVVAQRRRLSSHLLALCLSVLWPGPGLGRGASATGSRVSC